MAEEDCANPLLVKWVGEWLETARERNSKGVQTYRKAYNSLKSCPLTFQHPSEAQQLNGLGPKLCERLTEKLKEHCRENNIPMPEPPQRARRSAAEEGNAAAKKTRKPKAYVPTLRSGAYGIVLALSTISENAAVGLTKQQVIDLAQPHCDSSYTAPSDPTKFYTAWNSMKTLVEKDLVSEKGRPLRRYMLTEEGWEVVKRIKKTMNPGERETTEGPDEVSQYMQISVDDVRPSSRRPNDEPLTAAGQSDLVPVGQPINDDSTLPTFRPIILPAGSFSVQLVLDVREIRAKNDRDYLQEELSKKGINSMVRSLEVGDAMWVAKCNDANFLSLHGAEGDEVVLDWIIERKRLDDLVSSIKDGRFHEQKFRLRKSGVKNIVYIIEEISMNAEYFGKYEEAVQSAIASMQVVNGYFVKKTQKMDDTIRYLARMTALLQKLYESKPLKVIPTQILTTQNYLPLLTHLREREPTSNYCISYPAFSSLASKSDNLTLRDLYLKMLMCTKGISGEKALEIQKRWKTPQDFVKAFENCGTGEEGKKRKSEMVHGQMGNLVGRKKVAKALSHKLAEVWAEV